MASLSSPSPSPSSSSPPPVSLPDANATPDLSAPPPSSPPLSLSASSPPPPPSLPPPPSPPPPAPPPTSTPPLGPSPPPPPSSPPPTVPAPPSHSRPSLPSPSLSPPTPTSTSTSTSTSPPATPTTPPSPPSPQSPLATPTTPPSPPSPQFPLATPTTPPSPPSTQFPPATPTTPPSPPSTQFPLATPTTPPSPPSPQFPLATPTTPPPPPPPPHNDNANANANATTPATTTTSTATSTNSNQPTAASSPQPPASAALSAGAAASLAVVLVFLLAALILLARCYLKRKRRPAHGYNSVFVAPSPITTSPKTETGAQAPTTPFTYTSAALTPKPPLADITLANSKYFTYDHLHDITNAFSSNNVLGEGGFGCVYKGQLQDGSQVAVKRLTTGSDQGEREFRAEVEIISRVHHRHLVSLVGYCVQNDQRLLVYDYVPNNTLHYHLHGHGRPVLEWAIRVKVAAGAAHGIAYLHEDCHPRIIHRDIKSSNILLDNDFDALVADFGLARLALDAVTHVTTRVMGTFGYLAPEYASSGKLTERSDVYSFGVVLLELITGRKPVDTSRPLGDESLVEWARPLLSRALETGKLDELIDPRLAKNYNEVEMLRMIEAAAACVRHSASRRPRMSQVARVLDSLSDLDLTNGVQPGKSGLFNVANSAEIRLFQKMAFGSHDYDYSSEFSQMSTSSAVHLNPNTSRDYHNLL